MSNNHDSSYKFLFSTPELVRDLIIGFVPDEWLHSACTKTSEYQYRRGIRAILSEGSFLKIAGLGRFGAILCGVPGNQPKSSS
jgi:hypothetical protein